MSIDPEAIDPDTRKLIEIWKTLEGIVVSLDRIGALQGRGVLDAEAAGRELSRYFGPKMFRKLARSRTQTVQLLRRRDRRLMAYIEELAQSEDGIDYWHGPEAK